MATTNGIDVSAIGQGINFDWNPYRDKIGFAGIKVSESVNFADPAARRNISGARAIKAMPMAYHFVHAIPSGVGQANWFMARCKDAALERGDLMALDVEQGGQDGRSPAELWATAWAAAEAIHSHFGCWPVVYTDISLAQVAPSEFGQTPLWLANPSGDKLSSVGPWKLISFEQTGQRGVDVDVFYGDAATLVKLAIPAGRPTPTPPPPPDPTVAGLLVTAVSGGLSSKIVHSTDGGKSWS